MRGYLPIDVFRYALWAGDGDYDSTGTAMGIPGRTGLQQDAQGNQW